MAQIGKALFARLSNDSDVSALVSTRIYGGNEAPQNATKPYVVYHSIDGPRDYHLRAPSGLVNPRIQIDCWASTYSAAEDVKEAVRKSLSGARFTVAGIAVAASHLESERDIHSESRDLKGVSLDFTFWHHETV